MDLWCRRINFVAASAVQIMRSGGKSMTAEQAYGTLYDQKKNKQKKNNFVFKIINMRIFLMPVLLCILNTSARTNQNISFFVRDLMLMQSQENYLIHRLENSNIECELEIVKLSPRCFYEVINRAYKIHVIDDDLEEFFQYFCKDKSSIFWLYILKKYFNSKYDWVINAMIYFNYGYNDLPLATFIPNDISSWREKQKDSDYQRWVDFFENIDVKKLKCNCFVNDCYEHYGYNLTHKEPWGELYRKYRIQYKSFGYNFVLYAYKKHEPMDGFHPYGQFFERYKSEKNFITP